jgi:hypothetical protein
MNKKLKIFIISFFSFLFIAVIGLFILYNTPMIYKHPGLNSNVTFNIENAIIEVRIIDIKDNEIFIKPMHDYDKFVVRSDSKRKGKEFTNGEILGIHLSNVKDILCDLEVNKIVYVNYKFVDGYEGENPRYLNTVEYISDKQE